MTQKVAFKRMWSICSILYVPC